MITKTKGDTAENGFNGLITGKHCRMAVIRKYILANLRNWLRRDLGRKLLSVYLVVLM